MTELEFLKNSFDKKSTYTQIIITCIVVLLNYIAKKFSFIGDLLYVRIYLTIIPIVAFIPLNNFLRAIIKSKEKGFMPTNVYSIKKIIYSRIGRIIISATLLVILPFLLLRLPIIEILKNIKTDEQICNEDKKKIGILVANFTEIQGNQDGFSNTLFGKLNSDLQQQSAFKVQMVKNFINETDRYYTDTIKNVFKQNCSSKGLIIFGDSYDEKLFNCRIYSKDFFDFTAKSNNKIGDSTIIYFNNLGILKTPHFIHFTVDYEAQEVSDFIHALLCNYLHEYKKSLKYITKAINGNHNRNNAVYMGYCELIKGNNLYELKDFSGAIKSFEKGIQADSTIKETFYNMALAYRKAGNNKKAFEEYNIVKKMDGNLINPLREMDTFSSVSTKNKISKKTFQRKLNLILDSSLITKKDAGISADWDEHCYTISSNNKYGVINNHGDTIVKCKYDEIESYAYNGADCFIYRLNGKYGAVIHRHLSDSFTLLDINPDYKEYEIKAVVEYCIDNHR